MENRNQEKPTFATEKIEEIKYGKNNFIEVGRKTATTSAGTNKFISIAKGYFAPDNSKRYSKSNVSLPIDENVVNFVADNLKKMLK